MLVTFGELETLSVKNFGGTSLSTKTLDASTDKLAYVFQIPKSGNVTKIGFRTSTVTVADTLKITLQTVDSSGNPTGTLYGGSALVTQAAPASNTWYEVTLGTPAAAIQGDVVAAVIEFNSYVAGNLQITIHADGPKFPFINQNDAAAWAHQSGGIIMSLGYDDGSYGMNNTLPITAFTSQAYNSGSTPDERALKFSIPVTCRVCGASINIATAAGANFDVVLYDTDGTTVLASVSMDGDVKGGTAMNRMVVYFPTPVTLTAGASYRLSVKPTTANSVTVIEMTVNNAAYLEAIPGGTTCILSTRTDAGAWSDTTTIRPKQGLIIDQLDDGSNSETPIRSSFSA